MIYYFTGTGNCLWTAKKLGEALEQPITNIVSLSNIEPVTVSDNIVGLVFPTYMNDIPWIAKEFLLKLHISKESYCFAVMTSNHGKSGKAACNIGRALHANGAKLSACFDLQMQGNCIESSEKDNAERLKSAPDRLNAIVGQIKQRTVNVTSDGGEVGESFVTGSFFYGAHSLRRLTIINSFCVTDACNGCGLCQKICPTQNITIENKQAVHGNNCASCYACVHWCPVHATLPKFILLRNRKQYTHPEIKSGEIIQSEKVH
ncbi:MAG: EFR1 family ferrodoxin [Acutalibacteraceae bacterium]